MPVTRSPFWQGVTLGSLWATAVVVGGWLTLAAVDLYARLWP